MNRVCPKCEDMNAADAEFCATCGYRIIAFTSVAYFNGSELRQPRHDPRLKQK